MAMAADGMPVNIIGDGAVTVWTAVQFKGVADLVDASDFFRI